MRKQLTRFLGVLLMMALEFNLFSQKHFEHDTTEIKKPKALTFLLEPENSILDYKTQLARVCNACQSLNRSTPHYSTTHLILLPTPRQLIVPE